MKTINNNPYTIDMDKGKFSINGELNKLTEKYSSEVNNTVNNEQEFAKKYSKLSHQVSEELANIFGININKVHKLTHDEINEISDQGEVNTMEAKLAALFGANIYDKMLELTKNNRQPISLALVMDEYDEYESLTTA